MYSEFKTPFVIYVNVHSVACVLFVTLHPLMEDDVTHKGPIYPLVGVPPHSFPFW